MNWAQDSVAQGAGLERNGEGLDVHLCASYVSHCLNTFAANLSLYTFSWTRSFSSTVESPLKVVGHEGCAYTAANGDRNVSGSDEADEEGDSLSQGSHSTGIESQSESTDDGFGPHEFSGGVMHHRFADVFGRVPSWSRNRVPHDGRKCVSFNHEVELILDLEGTASSHLLNDADVHDVLRHLWHMDGQIASFEAMNSILNQFTRAEQCADQRVGNVHHFSHADGARSSCSDRIPQSVAGAFTGALWWNDVKVSCGNRDTRAPWFIATWFLDVERLHLCIRPKRIKITSEMTFEAFRAHCSSTWSELVDGRPQHFYLVDGMPPGLPSTLAHVIIVQGCHEGFNAVLLQGQGLPPLYSVRAVLYAHGISIQDFFRLAQFPYACEQRDYRCCLQFANEGRQLRLEDTQLADVPLAKFVQGFVRLMIQEDVLTSSDESTELPSSEEDFDDISSLCTVTASSSHAPSVEGTGDELQTEPLCKGEQQFPLFPHFWQEFKHDFTWCRHVRRGGTSLVEDQQQDLSDFNDVHDELVLASTHPILHFHDPPPPIWDLVDEQEVEDITEVVHEDATFADGHQTAITEYVELALVELDHPDQSWTAITYGLGLIDLGRRDVGFDPRNIEALPEKIQDLWWDHARYGDLTILFVDPQPTEVGGIRSLVLLVVVESPADVDPDMRNLLVIQRGPADVTLRPVPYGAKVYTGVTLGDILVQLDMHRHCKPFEMRDCIARVGYDVILPDQVHHFRNGQLCTVRVSDRPEAVMEAMDHIQWVEPFYLQVEELRTMAGEVFQVICHVHGISPANHPLGWRVLILEGTDLLHTDWISQMQRMWPFDYEEARLVFCPMATNDMREHEDIIFHFIVDYGEHEGHPVLVQQRIVVADDMPSRLEGAVEKWAITLMEGAITEEIVSLLAQPPFWFEYTLAQNIWPLVTINGRRIRDTIADWNAGDFLAVTLQVWKKEHLLAILLRHDADMPNTVELEHTALLQQKATLRKVVSQHDEPKLAVGQGFREICRSLTNPQRDTVSFHFSNHNVEPRSELPLLMKTSVREGVRANTDPDNSFEDLPHHVWKQEWSMDAEGYQEFEKNAGIKCLEPCTYQDPQIAVLRSHLHTVFSRSMEGINYDFSDIPDLHPHARCAQELTPCGFGSGVLHIFTDGSCKKGRATWAFTIVQQFSAHGPDKFRRVGFAAGHVDDALGVCEQTSLDAESTAIIAMIEFALGNCHHSHVSFVCHFDAITAGFGATGTYNVACSAGAFSPRQTAARTLMTILERKMDAMNGKVIGLHVKAHQGHPWNEMADSLAKAVWGGWTPHITFAFKSGDLLKHPLAQWAWLEVAPDAELPNLQTILRNDPPERDQGTIDSTLTWSQGQEHSEMITAHLNMATVNVGTMDYHTGTEYGMNWKAMELAKQFDEHNLHIVAIQESRARVSKRVTTGPYVRLVQAGDRGQAGVELWIHEHTVKSLFRADFNAEKDLCVWFSTPRILAVRCSLGAMNLDLMVLYAPQRGRPQQEISQWWKDAAEVFRMRTQDIPMFAMGDFNCRIGSVVDDAIGPYAGDIEDEAGRYLRHICNEVDLMIPSTFGHLHEGQASTFTAATGASSRIDFILIPKQCQHDVIRSHVASEIDVMNGDRDHKPLILEMKLRWKPKLEQGFCRSIFYDRDAARNTLHHDGPCLLDGVAPQEWSMDVNQHWSNLRQHLQQEAAKLFPKQKRKQRQHYFQPTTWQLLCDRRELRMQHRALQRAMNVKILQKFFHVWSRKDEHEVDPSSWSLDMSLLRQQEAITWEARSRTDSKFRECKKKDWKLWVDNLLQHKIDLANQRSNVELFNILQPKKMIYKHAGKLDKPLPGLRDSDGKWQFSRTCIAQAWQGQFSKIENAETVNFQDLLDRSKPLSGARDVKDLHVIPTLLDVEKSLRALNKFKAAGLDGLGAELFQQGCTDMARRVYPLVLKMGLRCQGIPEMTGGWLLPLFKNKGSAQMMEGYRAILLEPVLARAFSKAWRPMLERGLQTAACPMQWGGRSGLSIEALHLQVRMWQMNARRRQLSHFLIFIDIKSAFYSVVKEMLTGNEAENDIRTVFRRMGLPSTAWEEFRNNVHGENLIYKATQSHILAKNTQAMLSHTWFIIPDGKAIQAPLTGSRPGDPNADLLFSFVMTRILKQLNAKAAAHGMPLYSQDGDGLHSMRCVTSVDDIAISVVDTPENVVAQATTMLSLVREVMVEHGMRLSFGVGKTAVVAAFHGRGATKARQKFDQHAKRGIPVFTEHEGCCFIPVVSHYKHLGGHITRTGNCLQEIKVRTASVMAKLQPLRKILKNPTLDVSKKQIIVRSIGMSVLTLHSGTWTDLTQTEMQSWQAGVFKVYQMLQPRESDGEVAHKQMFQLADAMGSPMPIELMYIQRLRLLFHIMQVADMYMIHAVLNNFACTGSQSWLYGAIKAVDWMRRQVGNMLVPEELSELDDINPTWHDLAHHALVLSRSRGTKSA